MRRRFFVDAFSQGRAALTGDAAHHLGRVLRAEAGQSYELSDGQSVWLAQIEQVSRDSVDFALIEPIAARQSPLHATLLLAIVKFDRFEWAIEKATELGAETIVPLSAERSERALVAAAAKRAERWQRILLESAQQARCLRPPMLEPLRTPAEAFRSSKAEIKAMLSERSEAASLRCVFRPPGETQNHAGETPVHVALAVGPEGGWTDREFAEAASSGFREASLGSNILRTETAVAAALAAAHVFFDA